ncbi:ABC transporter permease [Haloglycomyces albus]|uniref:ABC transporter permease n=1 Tax=Haloglycomyces albus TaxID=526067 RepID=UPI00046CF536|nr:ABC transporter permease [Haloglycomyces albus]
MTEAPVSPDAQVSLWRDAFRTMRRRVDVLLSLAILVFVVMMAAFPRLFTSADPKSCDGMQARQRPDSWLSGDHPLGMDAFGCDFAAKLVHGTRPTLLLAFTVIIASIVIGLFLGIVAGYYGRWVDVGVSRTLEVFIVVPLLLGAILILSLFRDMGGTGGGVVKAILPAALALTLFGWMEFCRYARAATIETKSLDYVAAARCLGAKDGRIMFRHVLPNAIVPITAVVPTTLANIVVTESALAVLGVGIKPPETSWGILLAEGTNWAGGGYTYLFLWPLSLLVITVYAFATIGDALRDALDPKLR